MQAHVLSGTGRPCKGRHRIKAVHDSSINVHVLLFIIRESRASIRLWSCKAMRLLCKVGSSMRLVGRGRHVRQIVPGPFGAPVHQDASVTPPSCHCLRAQAAAGEQARLGVISARERQTHAPYPHERHSRREADRQRRSVDVAAASSTGEPEARDRTLRPGMAGGANSNADRPARRPRPPIPTSPRPAWRGAPLRVTGPVELRVPGLVPGCGPARRPGRGERGGRSAGGRGRGEAGGGRGGGAGGPWLPGRRGASQRRS